MTGFTSVDVRALVTMISEEKIKDKTESGFENKEFRLLFEEFCFRGA